MRAGLSGGEGFEGERVDLPLHQRAERLVDQPMPGERRDTGEARRNDRQGIVAAARLRASVTGVTRRIIDHVDRLGRKRAQARLDLVDGTQLGPQFGPLSSTNFDRNTA